MSESNELYRGVSRHSLGVIYIVVSLFKSHSLKKIKNEENQEKFAAILRVRNENCIERGRID